MSTFPSLVPGATASEGSYFMAMMFTAAEPVTVTGIRYFSGANRAGTGAGLYLEGGSGAGLATKMQNFVTGWNEVTFDAPVTLPGGPEHYVAGVLLPATASYSAVPAAPVTEGPLSVFKIGGFRSPAPASLTFAVAPHWLGAADDGRLEDSGTATWYGIQVVTSDAVPLDPIAVTAERTTDTSATLTWGPVADAPNGVSVLRAPGLFTADGSGDTFGQPGYDPTTIAGAAIVASGRTSPYVDTGLAAGTDYTYAVIRTGPGA